jgi:hypothetical protein
MIPEVYEKMWSEKFRWKNGDILLTEVNDYKFIELVDFYYYLYIGRDYNNNKI